MQLVRLIISNLKEEQQPRNRWTSRLQKLPKQNPHTSLLVLVFSPIAMVSHQHPRPHIPILRITSLQGWFRILAKISNLVIFLHLTTSTIILKIFLSFYNSSRPQLNNSSNSSPQQKLSSPQWRHSLRAPRILTPQLLRISNRKCNSSKLLSMDCHRIKRIPPSISTTAIRLLSTLVSLQQCTWTALAKQPFTNPCSFHNRCTANPQRTCIRLRKTPKDLFSSLPWW